MIIFCPNMIYFYVLVGEIQKSGFAKELFLPKKNHESAAIHQQETREANSAFLDSSICARDVYQTQIPV